MSRFHEPPIEDPNLDDDVQLDTFSVDADMASLELWHNHREFMLDHLKEFAGDHFSEREPVDVLQCEDNTERDAAAFQAFRKAWNAAEKKIAQDEINDAVDNPEARLREWLEKHQ